MCYNMCNNIICLIIINTYNFICVQTSACLPQLTFEESFIAIAAKLYGQNSELPPYK